MTSYRKPRQLDDEELDSGDDEGRNDRLADDDEMAVDDGQQPLEELMFMDVEFGRHPVPEPSDGEASTTTASASDSEETDVLLAIPHESPTFPGRHAARL